MYKTGHFKFKRERESAVRNSSANIDIFKLTYTSFIYFAPTGSLRSFVYLKVTTFIQMALLNKLNLP